MDQRISFVTLAVRDLGASRAFYVDGLGWEPAVDEPGEVLMFRAGDKLVLSLWDVDAFTAEVGQAPGGGLAPLTLSHNLATTDGVDRVLEQARVAGAQHVSEAREREWGGYSGYFADPDGHLWELCHNPGFPLDDQGRIEIGEARDA